MKKLHINMIFVLSLLFTGWSCSEEDNLDPEGNWELSTPSIQSPAENESIVLNEATPDKIITFTWEPAVSTVGYGVFYTVVFDTLASEDFESPILEIQSSNGGKGTSASISHKDLDEALSKAGYPANEDSSVRWAVKASSLSKSSLDSGDLSITRFATEIIPDQLYISGEATENGSDLAQAILLKRLNGVDKTPSNKHEIYTRLLADKIYKFYSAQSLPAHQYGGNEGTLVKNGDAITVPEEGIYRITVDLDNNQYTLFKIEQFGVIGNTFATGWGGDQVLEYQGGGVWKASIDFVAEDSFIFRANGEWVNILKRVVGTANEIVAESDADSQGVEYEDISSNYSGLNILTLDLSAEGYKYTIEKDPDAPVVSGPISTPEQLFLFADGVKMQELTKDGDTFTSEINLALRSGVEYTLNSAEDALGQAYTINTNLGIGGEGDAKVSATVSMTEDAAPFYTEMDQAYTVELNFAEAGLKWSYYNIYLFHWDEINQKWDDRNEFLMTYSHPYTYTVTADLVSNYDMKFNSPWDIEFGAEDAAALSGNITKDGVNIRNISTDGTYEVTIILSDNFETGTYEFVQK